MIFVCVFKYYKNHKCKSFNSKEHKKYFNNAYNSQIQKPKKKRKKKDNFLFSFSKKILDSTMKMKSLTS